MHWQVLVLVTGPLAQLQSSLIYFRRLVPRWRMGRGEWYWLIAVVLNRYLYHSMSGNWPRHSDSAVTVLDMGYTSTMLLISVPGISLCDNPSHTVW